MRPYGKPLRVLTDLGWQGRGRQPGLRFCEIQVWTVSASVSPCGAIPEVPVATPMPEHPAERQEEEQGQKENVTSAEEKHERCAYQPKESEAHQHT